MSKNPFVVPKTSKAKSTRMFQETTDCLELKKKKKGKKPTHTFTNWPTA